jgi:hypothetical protein
MTPVPETTPTTPAARSSEKPSGSSAGRSLHLPKILKQPPSQPRSETRSRLDYDDLWTYRSLILDAEARRQSLQIAMTKLNEFGQIMKEKLGFGDESILDEEGYVVDRQAWLDQNRPASSERPGSES